MHCHRNYSIVGGPNAHVREQIEASIRAKGVQLLQIKTGWWGGRTEGSSGVLCVARGRNVFGVVQNFYFEVDSWAAWLSTRPHVRELTSYEAKQSFE